MLPNTLATGAEGSVISTTDEVAAFVAAKYRQRLRAARNEPRRGNDYRFQRKNFDNFCTGPTRDPNNRDWLGVDVNRSYTVGSVSDGHVTRVAGVRGGSGRAAPDRKGSAAPL